MSQLAGYVLSVISGSIMVAVVCSFFDDKSSVSSVIKLICGLFLTFVVVNPFVTLDFSKIHDYLQDFTLEGMEVASSGENMAREAEGDIIKSRVQAYILDKAEFLGTQLDVEVILNQDNIPVSVELEGNISPYAKAQMAEMITEDLAIAKEYQLWIG